MSKRYFFFAKPVATMGVAFVALTACAAQPSMPSSGAVLPVSDGATSKALEEARARQAQPEPAKELTPEEKARHAVVAERSRQRTAAIIKRDYNTGYSYSTPGWRALYTVEHFRNQVSGVTGWKSAEVVQVDCEAEDKCRARVRVQARALVSGLHGSTIQTHVTEVWLRENNEWYFVEYR